MSQTAVHILAPLAPLAPLAILIIFLLLLRGVKLLFTSIDKRLHPFNYGVFKEYNKERFW